MSETKFSFRKANKPSGPAPEASAKVAETEVVTKAPEPARTDNPGEVQVPAVATDSPDVPRQGYHDDAEDVAADQVTMPRINIVQKVGPLSNIFNEGAIVFNKEFEILPSPKGKKPEEVVSIRMVVAGFRPDRWVEKTDGQTMGRLASSPEEVQALQGTTDYDTWIDSGKKVPYFERLAEALVLLEVGEDFNGAAFPGDGTLWAPCVWAMKGSSYTNGAKVLRSARKVGALADRIDPKTKAVVKSDYYHGVWDLRTFLKAYGNNFAWIPQLKFSGLTGPETRKIALLVRG